MAQIGRASCREARDFAFEDCGERALGFSRVPVGAVGGTELVVRCEQRFENRPARAGRIVAGKVHFSGSIGVGRYPLYATGSSSTKLTVSGAKFPFSGAKLACLPLAKLAGSRGR